ncbi:hypothetical protein JCM17960_02960 [Magnetospira thiophila]
MSAKRKHGAVLRVLRGEDLDLGSQSNLRQIPGSSENWNDTIASVKFSRTMEETLFQTFKRQFPVMPDAQIRQMISRSYGR